MTWTTLLYSYTLWRQWTYGDPQPSMEEKNAKPCRDAGIVPIKVNRLRNLLWRDRKSNPNRNVGIVPYKVSRHMTRRNWEQGLALRNFERPMSNVTISADVCKVLPWFVQNCMACYGKAKNKMQEHAYDAMLKQWYYEFTIRVFFFHRGPADKGLECPKNNTSQTSGFCEYPALPLPSRPSLASALMRRHPTSSSVNHTSARLSCLLVFRPPGIVCCAISPSLQRPLCLLSHVKTKRLRVSSLNPKLLWEC